ncbi:hypothetical protein V3C99_013468, partial [Haemonchus contortus]
ADYISCHFRMLALLKCSSLNGFCRTFMSSSSRSYSSRLSKISQAFSGIGGQAQPAMEGGDHATKFSYDQRIASQRVRGADAETGVIPTSWQKRCLVITRLYNTMGDIPQYVSGGTMNRMHDRMRVVFIVVAVACFFALFYYSHYANVKKVARDRQAGKIVKHM